MTGASTPNATTLVLTLNKAVNPLWFTENMLALVQPMPVHAWAKASVSGPVLDFTNPANAKKIYDFLAKESRSTGTYATNPLWQVVDGPYRLTVFNNTTGAYTMAPNPSYGGPHSKIVPTLQAVPYTSDTAEFNAVLSHSIDIGYMPQTDVPQLDRVKAAGYHAFGYPDWGFTLVNYNFADKTGDFNNIIKQLYVRQALAHLEDEEGYVKAFFHGPAGWPTGRCPPLRRTPYTPANALKNPYPFSISAAANLLKSHGWNVVPGGTSTCAKPGTGSGECGAGIPAGTKLAFNVLYINDPTIVGEQITDWASEAKKVGIDIALQAEHLQPRRQRGRRSRLAEDHQPVGDGLLGRLHQLAVPDDVRRIQHRRLVERRVLQRPGGEQADQRVGERRQPGRGQGRGVLPHAAAAEPVPAQPRLHRGVEGQRLRPAGRDSGDDPVLPQHGADVPDEVTRSGVGYQPVGMSADQGRGP